MTTTRILEKIKPADYDFVINHLNDWWGGRNMSDMLPRMFFNHFGSTSFIMKEEGTILGFIIGFISPNDFKEAFVHFVGVNPDYRKENIGRKLYHVFFKAVKAKKVKNVECVTCPVNSQSIEFHKKLGFKPKESLLKTNDGVPYFENYNGQGEDRVILRINIEMM